MVNLTEEEWKDIQKGLGDPEPRVREYGHRGKITAGAVRAGRETSEADSWAVQNDGSSSQDNTKGVTR